jgi:hypothetical protein
MNTQFDAKHHPAKYSSGNDRIIRQSRGLRNAYSESTTTLMSLRAISSIEVGSRGIRVGYSQLQNPLLQAARDAE